MIANASRICHEGGRAVFILWLTKAYLDSQDVLANQIWAMKTFYGQHKFRSSQFGFVSTGTVQHFFEKFRPRRVEERSASIPFAGDQHVKAFAHTCRGDQMLELQRDFGSLLRKTAVFKGIGELILFTDSHQEL